MHEISHARSQVAKDEAKQSEQQGREIEAFGKTIEADLEVATEAQGEAIEEAGKAAQRHATASYDYAQEADETGSREAFAKAGSEHVKEGNEKVKAVKVYGEVVQTQSQRSMKALDQDRKP